MNPRSDPKRDAVASALVGLRDFESRVATVLRETLDQIYDGQRTGRYKWDQLYKTEKTHCGTLVEINMQREFRFDDGDKLDYKIAGVDVDCKYSQNLGRWMIPNEARGELCLVLWADDQRSIWSMGLVRALEELLTKGRNRDRKANLNKAGQTEIHWLFRDADLPLNVLLQLSTKDVETIMSPRSGAKRIRRLFRIAQGQRIGRGVVATVAQQADFMKRVRGNGGARSPLRPEGIVILGQSKQHQEIAHQLGLPVPAKGESVSARLSPAHDSDSNVALIDGSRWRVANAKDPVVEAPILPT